MTQGINASPNVKSPVKTAIKTAAVVAGAASVYYALKNGQVADTFEGSNVKRTQMTLVDGYKKLGKVIKEKAVNVVDSAKKFFKAANAEEMATSLDGTGASVIFTEFNEHI